ncbi:MAG: YraN family protein [Alphaproteobacteria bacterium]|nr:YraN family protein [Alphaproteobacteria bacterium]
MTADRRAAEARGRWAERIAALALRIKGYRILARRFRVGAGEIDLIARRGGQLVAVEVKARSDLVTALESISLRQRQRINDAMEIFCQRHRALAGLPWRFDVVVVRPGRWPRHIVDAWRDD